MDWSEYQRAIIRHIRLGEGDGLGIARAGVGKTSTIVEGARESYIFTLLLAYNTRMTHELQKRIKGFPATKAIGLNGLGHGALMRAFDGQVEVSERRKWARARMAAEKMLPEETSPDDMRAVVRAAAGIADFAKNTLLTETPEEILSVMNRTGIGVTNISLEKIREIVELILALTRADPQHIDFTDQVWLPVVMGLPTTRAPNIVVDEAQDLNPAQIALVRRAVLPGGRVTAIGDDRQVLYLWRGADVDVFTKVVQPKASFLLPISYRLPKSGVELAQLVAPDIEAAPHAIEGEVRWEAEDVLREEPEPGDVVLSYTNAPLLRLCLGYLKRGKRASVAGKDIGKGLSEIVLRSNQYRTRDFEVWLREYRLKEVERVLGLDNPSLVEDINDRVETLQALLEGLSTTNEVVRRIETLFAECEDETDRIVCSTVHRFKGLERPRVFLVHWTFFKEDRYAESGFNDFEHRRRFDFIDTTAAANVYYVATTRHRQELVCCGGPPPGFLKGPGEILAYERLNQREIENQKPPEVYHLRLVPPPEPRRAENPFKKLIEEEERAYADSIPEELQAAMDANPEAEFVLSCAEQWEEKRWLSEAQLRGLAKWGRKRGSRW